MTTSSVTHRRCTFSGFLTAIGGTFFCSSVLVFVDVVLDGSYIFSVAICPIWFVISVTRVILRPPTFSVGAARVLIPIATVLLAIANYSVQSAIAYDNAARVIHACERYRKENGDYPESLSELVPRYLGSVPRVKYCWSYGVFRYNAPPHATLSWLAIPPFGWNVYDFDTREWRYID